MSSPADDFPEDETNARLRALYRQLPADEPSAATDDAILAAARRATKSGPAAVPWTRRWRVPLAAAATLLLAFGILLQMPTQRTVVQDAFHEQQALDEKSSMNAEPSVVAAAPPAEIAADAGPPAESVPQQRAPESLAKEKREFAAVPSPAPAKKSVTAAKAAAEPAAELADADDAEATGSGSASASGAIAAAAETRAEMETDTADALAGAQQQQAESARERMVAEAKAEVAAASSSKSLRNAPSAPVAAAAPPPAPAALQPRGAPWPFGLVPTLAPDTACARLIQESGGDCRARIVSGGLELRLTGGDNQWLYRLRDSLAELGWQEAPGVPAGSGRYSRRTTAGIERFEWSPQSGALVLKLLAAD